MCHHRPPHKRMRMFLKLKKSKNKKKKRASALVVCSLVCCFGALSVFIFHYTLAYLERAREPIEIAFDPNLGIRPYVIEFFTDNDAEEMIPIIDCESEFKHFNTDGEVLKNRQGSSATGIAQILTSKHPDPKALAKYNRMHNTDLIVEDFDIKTLQGNLGYALLLYEIRGTRDWECAKIVRLSGAH